MLTSTDIEIDVQAPAKRKNDISFSWKKEIGEIFSPKFFSITWWPLFKYRQFYLTRSHFFKYCRTLTGFGALWSTIQKGSFAYNHFFLRIRPFHSIESSTDLADITTLTILLGDEFIDGICNVAGKCNILKMVAQSSKEFYFQKIQRSGKIMIRHSWNIDNMLQGSILEEINPKYEISYSRFYSLLQYSLQLINHLLSFLPVEKAGNAADKILDICNSCIDSYFHDLNCEPIGEKISDIQKVLSFHDLKSRQIQQKLLELRFLLVNKQPDMETALVQGWLDITSVLQILDDLQDVIEDDGFQDNIVISTAFHVFKEEWNWFVAHKSMLQKMKHRQLLLSIYMPKTVNHCLQLVSTKIETMNWEQKKIMNYLLFKNWFIPDKDGWRILSTSSNRLLLDTFIKLKEQMKGCSNEEIKSYAMSTCFHLYQGRKYFFRKLSLLKFYRLRYNLLTVPSIEKALIFDKLLRR